MMNRTNLDLDVLRSFVAGVELRSFAQASTRVGRSQSAVSAQLRKLEDQSGRPLLRRAGRGLALTEAGEVMLSYARRLLELNDEAVAAVRGVDLDGWVRLGLPQDFAEGWLPGVLGRFARAHPGIRVEVAAGRNAELLPRVGAGTLDLALAWGESDGAHAERLAELPMVWIGPASGALPWRAGEPLPLVAFEPPCRFRAAGTAALDAAGIQWRLSFTSPGLSGLWAAVAAGMGVSPRTSAGLPGTVRVLEPHEAGLPAMPRISLSLHRADAEPAPAAARLALILREAVAECIYPRSYFLNQLS
jgi:DNA-binding transcriptional LysR family regulator